MFYESKNSSSTDLPRVEIGQDFTFPSHFHSSYELIVVTSGHMTVGVDKNQYNLTAGDAVLVFPNQAHSLTSCGRSEHVLCIFSPRVVKAFNNLVADKIPDTPLFRPSKFYVERLTELYLDNSLIEAKGVLYSLCAQFGKSVKYRERTQRSENLLMKIFSFVENGYAGDCSLEALARYTAYSTVYLSRYFKQYTGISYTDHVNRYRVNEAVYLINNTDKKFLEIAFECGFNSVRNFNRKFKEVTGMTPNEYRQGGVSVQ